MDNEITTESLFSINTARDSIYEQPKTIPQLKPLRDRIKSMFPSVNLDNIESGHYQEVGKFVIERLPNGELVIYRPVRRLFVRKDGTTKLTRCNVYLYPECTETKKKFWEDKHAKTKCKMPIFHENEEWLHIYR